MSMLGQLAGALLRAGHLHSPVLAIKHTRLSLMKNLLCQAKIKALPGMSILNLMCVIFSLSIPSDSRLLEALMQAVGRCT